MKELRDVSKMEKTGFIICRFFKGENPIPTDEDNNNCDKDGGNCDDPTKPCGCHYNDKIKEVEDNGRRKEKTKDN